MTVEEKAEEYAIINCGSHPIQEDLREASKYSWIDGYITGQREMISADDIKFLKTCLDDYKAAIINQAPLHNEVYNRIAKNRCIKIDKLIKQLSNSIS